MDADVVGNENVYERVRARPKLAVTQSRPVQSTVQKIRKDELVRMLIAGLTVRQCADRLNMSTVAVRHYIAGEAFQQTLRELSEDVWTRVDEELKLSKLSLTQRIEEMSDRALAKIAELMESDDDRVAFRAASDTLDRNKETSKQHKVDTTSTVLVLDPVQLALAAQAANEISLTPRNVTTVPKDAVDE